MELQQPFAISRGNLAGFSYQSPYSINAAQVPSTQTDFPVLVSLTDTRLKTVGNGGHVQDAQGDDIRPYSDSGIVTAITGYEKVFYDGTNGILEMWVKVASLSSSTTPIYLAYGNPSLTTDGSDGATCFSNNFLGVYHLADGTTLNVNSSTGTNNGSLPGGSGNPTATTGQIDGGAAFVRATSQRITLGSGINPTAITLSGWANASALNNQGVVVRSNGTSYSSLQIRSDGKLSCHVKGNADIAIEGTGSHTLSTSTWYLLHMTYNSTAGLVAYVNSASDGTAAANGALTTTGSASLIGGDPSDATRFWAGSLDEIRVSSIARAADWITTEYNNQSAPATFATLGTEVPL